MPAHDDGATRSEGRRTKTSKGVRYRAQIGSRTSGLSGQLLTQLYGPTVHCKPDLNKWRLVLRICIRPLHGAFVLLAIMDIRAHPISFSERP